MTSTPLGLNEILKVNLQAENFGRLRHVGSKLSEAAVNQVCFPVQCL